MIVAMMVIAVSSLLVVAVLDTETVQLSAQRNTADYERALYLAGAAVHHALAELEDDASWRSTVTEGSYPGDDTYWAEAIDGSDGDVVVTGIGVAGSVTRKLQATVVQGN